MHKNIFIISLITALPLLSSSSTEYTTEALREAIKKCRIQGLVGEHNSKICELRSKFLHPDLMGELDEYENFFILYGKTGNGKSAIAQNLADECFFDARLFKIRSNIYMGDPEDLDNLFRDVEMHSHATKAILIIDDIDYMKISHNPIFRNCFCEFLKKNRNNKNLLVIGTTTDVTLLHEQIKSYFRNFILVDFPDLQARKDILHHYSNEYVKLDDTLIDQLAQKTGGLSRRSLENIILHIRQQLLISEILNDNVINIFVLDERRAER